MGIRVAALNHQYGLSRFAVKFAELSSRGKSFGPEGNIPPRGKRRRWGESNGFEAGGEESRRVVQSKSRQTYYFHSKLCEKKSVPTIINHIRILREADEFRGGSRCFYHLPPWRSASAAELPLNRNKVRHIKELKTTLMIIVTLPGQVRRLDLWILSEDSERPDGLKLRSQPGPLSSAFLIAKTQSL